MFSESTSILFILVGGAINASFIVPTKYIAPNRNEKIWIYHSIVGLVAIPWLFIIVFFPSLLPIYLGLDFTTLYFLIAGGVIFGLGQICFMYAIQYIGIALSFAINLGIGITLGSMFAVIHQNAILNWRGYLVMLAILLVLLSLIIYYHAGKTNNQKQLEDQSESCYQKGWFLACLAGIASGLQNITFLTTAFYSPIKVQINNAFWIWPPFLLAAMLPMVTGLLYRLKKPSPTAKAQEMVRFLSIRNFSLIVLMGLFFTGSLVLYSLGMSQLNKQQQVVGWPVFIISIILTSQIWGWVYQETSVATHQGKVLSILSMTLLILAILILSIKI